MESETIITTEIFTIKVVRTIEDDRITENLYLVLNSGVMTFDGFKDARFNLALSLNGYARLLEVEKPL